MHIGLDARKLWDGGIGTYIRQLVHAAATDPETRFTLFVDAHDAGRIGWPAGVSERVVRAGKYSFVEHFVLPRAARATRVDLFHAPHYTLPFDWRGPAVVTIHDLIHIRFARFYPPGAAMYASAVAGSAARRARLVVADSAHGRDEIVRLLRVPPDKVRVIPLGVSTGLTRRSADAVTSFRRARGLPADYLLYVGARKPHKGLATLIDALGALPGPARPPLVLSGPPWRDGDPLAMRARARGILDEIAFAGGLATEDDLACLYSGAMLYAQPSLDEGFGLPPLEAMACGAPVLASDIVVHRENLEGAAELARVSDADAWADALARLLGDSAARAALGARGPERAARFTWTRTAELTRAAYARALSA